MNNTINPQWIGEDFGIALSYVIITYGNEFISFLTNLFLFEHIA